MIICVQTSPGDRIRQLPLTAKKEFAMAKNPQAQPDAAAAEKPAPAELAARVKTPESRNKRSQLRVLVVVILMAAAAFGGWNIPRFTSACVAQSDKSLICNVPEGYSKTGRLGIPVDWLPRVP